MGLRELILINHIFFGVMRPSECASESTAFVSLPQGRLKDIAIYSLYLHCKLV